LIDFRDVVWGDIGENKDWNIVVVKDSRCFGVRWLLSESASGDMKLFITSYAGLAGE